MARILTVDDEPVILNILNKILISQGYEVVPARNGEEAITILKRQKFDLVVSDINMSPGNGMDVLHFIRDNCADTGVVMLTAFGTVSTAVEAMKAGAFDYLTKPFKLDELQVTVKRALEYQNVMAENRGLKSQLEARYRLENIVAESPRMIKVCEMIERVAPTNTTVLIYGESGTGKELVAHALHTYSTRRNRNFVAVNCAALPEALLESEMFGHVKGAFTGATTSKDGLFETANGGTLFLDEISSMPLSVQSKLLRAIQEMQIRKVGTNKSVSVDVRVLAASNEQLETLISEGRFREDLFYRLSVITLDIPPLRERREDILPLVQHFLKHHAQSDTSFKIDHEAENIIENYEWPGNVRELQNVIQHAITFADDHIITRESLPSKVVASAESSIQSGPSNNVNRNEEFKCKSLKTFLRSKEKEYLQQVMQNMKGDKEQVAKALDISMATLYRKLSDDE
ncbi:MAG: sigma-54-dependent Fis family transcriptional regulator [Spartobacteria bacterium]|nr:sigma-54-dependent Fis family transcriptional regulator [Spartobacteria bacterium]